MLLKQVLKDLISVACGTTFARGIAIANTVLIARMISPSEYGVFAVFYAVMILSWQFPQAFDGVFVALSKKSFSKTIKRDFLKSSLSFKLIYVFVLLLLAYPLATVISEYGLNKAALKWPIIYGFVCGSLLTFLSTIASVYQEQERYARFGIIHAFYTTGVLIGLLSLVFSGHDITLNNVFLLYVTVTVAIGVLSLFLMLKKTGNLLSVDRNILMKTFKEGKWVFLSTSAYCVFERMAMLVLPRFVSNEEVGVFAVGAQLASVVALASGSLAGICLPRASLALRSRTAFLHFMKELFYAIILIESGIAICYFMAPFIVLFFYGSQYVSSVSVLQVLLIGWSVGVIFIPFSFLLIAMEVAKFGFYIDAAKLTIGLFLCFLMIPIYGLHGAAYAVAVTEVLSLIISFAFLKAVLKLPPENDALSSA